MAYYTPYDNSAPLFYRNVDRNVYRAHLGTDTLTNLGPMSWKFVRDKIKIIQRYQSSILGLKLEPLTTAHVGSAKHI